MGNEEDAVFVSRLPFIYKFVLTSLESLCILLVTEPDTPLNDAYHVGAFNL